MEPYVFIIFILIISAFYLVVRRYRVEHKIQPEKPKETKKDVKKETKKDTKKDTKKEKKTKDVKVSKMPNSILLDSCVSYSKANFDTQFLKN